MTRARIHNDTLNQPLSRLFFGSDYDPSSPSKWTPRVDVIENKEAYEVIAEIPGINKEEIHLAVEDNVLTLSGEKHSARGENELCLRHERSSGTFERSFRLPKEVDATEIKAKYINGVLTVTLPKTDNAKPKQISIH